MKSSMALTRASALTRRSVRERGMPEDVNK